MNNYTSNFKMNFALLMKSLLMFLLISYSMTLSAQIPMGVEVNVFPPYPTQYNVWIADGANYMITIQNNSDTDFEYYIRAGIEGESGGEEVFARISRDFFPAESLTIGPYETQIISPMDLEDLYRNATIADLDRSPNVPLEIDAELPEGTYMLCFELMLFDNSQEVFLSPKICSDPFFVSHNSLLLQYPLDGSTWSETDIPVTFQWINNSSSNLTGDYEYELSIYEIDGNSANEESIYEYIESGAIPFYQADPTPDLNLVYDVDFGLPEFTEGNLYAARVKVINPGGAYFDGGGVSNIHTFWFGHNPYEDGDGSEEEDEPIDCFQRCQIPPPTNTTAISSYSDISNFQIGNVTVENLQLADITEGIESISGSGEVTISFLNDLVIDVEFSGVTLNTERKALSGDVLGKTAESNVNLVQRVANLLGDRQPLDQDDLNSLIQIANNIINVNKLLNGEAIDFPFGIAQEIDGQAFTFMMTRFSASIENAEMDFVNILDFGALGDGFKLALGASDVCIDPSGFGNQFKINLLEDAYIPLDGDLALTFKGGLLDEGASYDLKENQSPCYFEMACEGFKTLNISGTLTFPQSMLKKEVEGIVMPNENAKGYFSTTYEKDYSNLSITHDPIPRSDFIVGVTMDDFQISKLKGWGFSIENATLDLSETKNPVNLEFPAGYQNEYTVEDEWKGLYIKDATLRTPKDYSEDGVVGTAAINHIIIENKLSMDIEGINMLSRDHGVFKGWSLGIDTFKLRVLQNHFQHGELDGEFGVPVMEDGEYLGFHSLIQENNEDPEATYYTFDGFVQPSDNINIPMAVANASICQSSYLALKMSPIEEERLVEVFLKGDLDINTGSIGSTITGNAYMELADYQVHYNSFVGFVMPEEIEDGRGSYFGMENNEAIDCSNLTYTTLQEAMDYAMDGMIENGEGVFRSIAQDIGLDNNEVGSGTFRDGDEMNGLPIRFDKSRLEIVDGAPILNLVVEAQLSPESIVEAGIIVSSEKIQEEGSERFRIGNPDVEFYFTEGSISLNQPFNGSGLATNEPVTVAWTANFQDEVIKNRLTYDIKIIELTEDDDRNKLDSIFRARSTFFHEVEGVSGSQTQIALNSVSPSFTSGKQYAFRLMATDPEADSAPLNNDGYSNINVVTWGQTAIVGTNAGNNSACAYRCSPALPSDTLLHAAPASVNEFTMGNFTIEVVGTPALSGDMISGQGIAKFDGFLNDARVGVDFLNVKINRAREAFAGVVNGRRGTPALLDQVSDYIAGNSESAVIQTLNETLDETRMIFDVMTGGEIDLPFGVNVNMSTADGSQSNSVNIAFTDFNLTPTTSDVDFLFMMSLPSLGEGFNFGLGAQDICIGPDGFGNEAKLYLPNDLNIPIDGEVELAFNGGLPEVSANPNEMTPQEPFYLEIDCDGFKALNISGSATFPRSMLAKENPETRQVIFNDNVKGYFSLNLQKSGGNAYVSAPTEDRTDILIAFQMDPFQIKGLDGWGFELMDAVLDLSESSNIAGMQFPENYDMEDLVEPDMWTGFYLKTLRIKPPANYQLESDAQANTSYAEVSNLMIDPKFSAVFSAENILSYEQGNIKGWGISVDSIGVGILQNNFVGGGMKGVMGAPPLKEGDRLLYQAVLSRQANLQAGENDDNEEEGFGIDDERAEYKFTAIVRPPADSLSIPIMVGRARICPSSYLGFQIGKGQGQTHLELFLKSVLDVDLKKYLPTNDNNGATADGKFNIAMADFQLQYNTVNGFVMENEVLDGKGTSFGVGLTTGDVCDADPFFPDFQKMLDDHEQNGGSNTNRDVAATDDSSETTGNNSGTNESDNDGDNGGDNTDPNNSPSLDDLPRKSGMNGFPIRIQDFKLELVDGAPVASIVVDLSLASDGQGFAAGAGITLHTRKELNEEGKEKYKFDHVEFDCARLATDFDMLQLAGCLCYESESDGDGNSSGYFGRVLVQSGEEIYVDLQGGFATHQEEGALIYGESDYHGYWYIDGTFASNTGIPMGPIRLNALGGGIYWNMAPPELPSHNSINEAGPGAGAAQEVADCIADLVEEYDLDMPNGGAPLDVAPSHDPRHSDDGGTFGKRTIKVNAGLSMADPKLLCVDPQILVEWTAGQGIDAISLNGYFYFLQQSYFARGAGSTPEPDDTNGETIPFAPATGSDGDDEEMLSGSRIWLSTFNTLYFDRTAIPGRTLTAFHGHGGVYMNLIPDVMYGDDDSAEEYRMIAHDIFIGHPEHAETTSRGYSTSSGGTYWHAYLGNPYAATNGTGGITGASSLFNAEQALGRGRLRFSLGGQDESGNAEEPTGEAAGVEVTAYMMLGHGIPTQLPEPPAFILDIIEGRESSEATDAEDTDSGYDGEAISESDAQREELTDKTSGFALGATVGVNCGFERIIYATLEVVLGFDLLFMNVAGMQCIAQNGNLYDPPGVNNFYGMGQIFAGIKGEVGVRGRILGTEVNVEFLSLAAALLIKAGGPNPFWVDGKAAIRYRVLGGLIKGNARVEVQVGDLCYPYNAAGFNLDVVDKVYPNSTNHLGDNAVAPTIHPKITFKMPVTEPETPWLAELTVPEIDPQGNTHIRRVAPVMEHYNLYRDFSDKPDTLVAGRYEFSSTKRSVRYIPSEALSNSDQQVGNRRFKTEFRVRAKERINGQWDYIEEFTKDTVEVFGAQPLPPYEEFVTHTNPIRGERHFMPEEWSGTQKSIDGSSVVGNKEGIIKFFYNVSSDRFYSTDQYDAICNYDIIWKDGESGDEEHRYRLTSSDMFNRKVIFPIPDLDNDKLYILQLVRVKTGGRSRGELTGKMRNTTGKGISLSIEEEYDVSNDYAIEFQEDDENAYAEVLTNEELLHMVVFRTSKYETLSDKMANVDISVIPEGTSIGSPKTGNWSVTEYDEIIIPFEDEAWEEIEMIGYEQTLTFGTSNNKFFTQPRVLVVDPLEGIFFDDKVKPKMNPLIREIRDEVDEQDVGLTMAGPQIEDINFNNLPNQISGLNGNSSSQSGQNSGNSSSSSEPLPVEIDFPHLNYSYINHNLYVDGYDETYAESSVTLNDYSESSSYFISPIQQESGAGFLNGGVSLISKTLNGQQVNTDVKLRYNVRFDVKQDIDYIVNFCEPNLDLIQNGSQSGGGSNIIQSLTESQINDRFGGVFSAYNALVNSALYNGTASTIDYDNGWNLSLFPNGGIGKTTLGSSTPTFHASKIQFFYNTNPVTDLSGSIGRYGSIVEKVIDD